MLGLDASFARLDLDFFQKAKPQGYGVFFQDCWTGGYANNPALRDVAEPNLRDAQAGGLVPAIYSNANPWYPAGQSLRETKANAGSMWNAVKVVAVDLEIAGTTAQQAFDLGMAFEAEGKTVCVYTAQWVYDREGEPDWECLTRWPLWMCQDDHNPALASAHPVASWSTSQIIGKQYNNESGLLGKEVDLDVFEWAALAQEEYITMPTLEELQKEIEGLRKLLEIAVSKIQADNDRNNMLQSQLLQAWTAYNFAPITHVDDKKRHVDSETWQRIDDLLKSQGR